MALISLRQLLDHAAEHDYGVPAFNVNNVEQVRAIMDAVKQGELDIQIEDVAEQGTAELRLKAPLKPVKKAS